MSRAEHERRADRAGTGSRGASTSLAGAVVMASFLAACAAAPPAGNAPAGNGEDGLPGGTMHSHPPVTELNLSLCPMRVSNAPEENGGRVARRAPHACTGGVELLVVPAEGVCLSSGFGPRSGRIHSGVDYHARPAVEIVAAAPGTVRVAGFRARDFGHWIVIDHGGGVFTGYAHLASPGARVGVNERVEAGQTLGLMGASGAASSAVHLHYEIRRGDFGNPRGWFGLQPLDPFSLPGRCASGA